jgi:hypothetical protein
MFVTRGCGHAFADKPEVLTAQLLTLRHLLNAVLLLLLLLLLLLQPCCRLQAERPPEGHY